MGPFDATKIDIECPGCGRRIQETLGRLKNSPTLVCPNCQQRIAVDGKEAKKGLDSVDRSLRDLDKALKGLGKR